MTPQQRKYFYFPIWAQTSARLDWRMNSARLVADLDEQFSAALKWPDPAGETARFVITTARMTAVNESRAVTAEDLRHACNWLASSRRTDSSTKFTQRDLNQFDRLCAVLRGPWDLTATMAWLNPAEDDRKRTRDFLKKLTNEGRLVAISRNAYHTGDWESLNQGQLDWLVSQVKGNGFGKYPRGTNAETAEPRHGRAQRGAKVEEPF